MRLASPSVGDAANQPLTSAARTEYFPFHYVVIWPAGLQPR